MELTIRNRTSVAEALGEQAVMEQAADMMGIPQALQASVEFANGANLRIPMVPMYNFLRIKSRYINFAAFLSIRLLVVSIDPRLLYYYRNQIAVSAIDARVVLLYQRIGPIMYALNTLVAFHVVPNSSIFLDRKGVYNS